MKTFPEVPMSTDLTGTCSWNKHPSSLEPKHFFSVLNWLQQLVSAASLQCGGQGQESGGHSSKCPVPPRSFDPHRSRLFSAWWGESDEVLMLPPATDWFGLMVELNWRLQRSLFTSLSCNNMWFWQIAAWSDNWNIIWYLFKQLLKMVTSLCVCVCWTLTFKCGSERTSLSSARWNFDAKC